MTEAPPSPPVRVLLTSRMPASYVPRLDALASASRRRTGELTRRADMIVRALERACDRLLRDALPPLAPVAEGRAHVAFRIPTTLLGRLDDVAARIRREAGTPATRAATIVLALGMGLAELETNEGMVPPTPAPAPLAKAKKKAAKR